MNIDIEKIENGLLLTIGERKMHANDGTELCGFLAEWALKYCEDLATVAEQTAKLAIAVQSKLAQAQVAAAPSQWTAVPTTPFPSYPKPPIRGLSLEEALKEWSA